MIALISLALNLLAALIKSKSRLEAENAALRQQLIVLQRKLRGRVRFSNDDRLFFIQLYRWFPSILKAMLIIRPRPRALALPLCLLAIAFLVGMLAPAAADRKPTPDERAKIETVLREQGFTRWKDIEFDDDDKVWEVDDAVGSDGREYHLKLDVNNLAIVKREQSSSSNRAR